MACLIAADRYSHLEREIRPAVARGDTVVCDRYVASSLVLQVLDGVGRDCVWELNRHADMPDLAVIINARADALTKRLETRGAHSRYEREPGGTERECAMFHPFEYSFYEWLYEVGYRDAFRGLHLEALEYSWVGRTGDGYRYDHAHVSHGLMPAVSACSYIHDVRTATDRLTDHSALTLSLAVRPVAPLTVTVPAMDPLGPPGVAGTGELNPRPPP